MAPTLPHQLRSITLILRDTSNSPEAPSASTKPNVDGYSPTAIIAIVAAIVVILVLVPLLGVILRRHQRKKCLEMIAESAASRQGSKDSSVKSGQSLKSIMVTREVQRSSLTVSEAIRSPERAFTNEKGWSRTEVRGGKWK